MDVVALRVAEAEDVSQGDGNGGFTWSGLSG